MNILLIIYGRIKGYYSLYLIASGSRRIFYCPSEIRHQKW